MSLPAPGQHQDVFSFCQPLKVQAGIAPGMGKMAAGKQTAQGSISPGAAGQQSQVITSGNLHFRALDGFDACPGSSLVKFNRRGDIVVVSYGQSGHIQLGRPLCQSFDGTGPIQKGKRAMGMQVNEFHRFTSIL